MTSSKHISTLAAMVVMGAFATVIAIVYVIAYFAWSLAALFGKVVP
jgi:hypothetical protein